MTTLTETRLSGETQARIKTELRRYPRPRSALLPALKIAQQQIGYLPPAAVAEVADLVGVPHTAAAELIHFYSMLRTEPAGRVVVEICDQLPCALAGSERLIGQLSEGLGVGLGQTAADGGFTLVRTHECFGACHRAPMCRVNDEYREGLDPEAAQALVHELVQGPRSETKKSLNQGAVVPSAQDRRWQPILLPHPDRTEAVLLAEYRALGGYEAWLKALTGMTPEEVIEEVKRSGLRGRGGAGFPAGMKWSFVPKFEGPKYLCVNADESEPGTFKDRELMEIEPHMVLEGVAIAAYAIGAHMAFIYIRGEYVTAAERLDSAIEKAKAAGLLGPDIKGSGFGLEVIVFRGAGAYICGEETALLESLEGSRPMPRSRPPFPAVEGLYGSPTVVTNVETLANVPHIIARGGDWYQTIGSSPRNSGPKIFCLSGRVNRPGNYELPLGAVTVRELVEECGAGVAGGRKLKAVLPAGASATILSRANLDARLDWDSIQAAGSMLGSASLIVLDDSVCVVRAAVRMAEFFRRESCGKCTPCREGTVWLHQVLSRLEEGGGSEADLELLLSVSGEIGGKVLCALGDFAVSPVTATITQFRDEYLEHLRLGHCPFPSWAES